MAASNTYSTNDLTLSFALPTSPNSNYGTMEDTTNYDILRFTSENLKGTADSFVSEEVNAERMTTGIIRTDIGAGGTVNSHLSFGDHDKMIQYGLQAAAAPAGTASATAATAAASNVITDTEFETASGWNPGRWVYLSSATDPTIDGLYRITTLVEATSITVAGKAITAGPTDLAATLLNFITNGTTCQSFGIVKYLEGGTNPDIYESLPGSAVNSMTINGSRGGPINISYDFISQQLIDSGSTHPSAGGNAAVGTNPLFSSVGNFDSVVEANSLTATTITEFSFTVTNNLRPQNVMGTAAAIGIGNGSMTLEGSYTKFFQNTALLNKFLNNTTSQFGLGMTDDDGNHMVFDAPAIKYTDAEQVGGGKDTDMFISLSFQGFKDPSADDLKQFSFHTV